MSSRRGFEARISPEPSQKKRQKVEVAIPATSENYLGMGNLLKTGNFSDIEVVVGTGANEHVFNLHKAVLSQNSGYFAKMLKNDNFEEGKESRVLLTNYTESDFGDVVRFLYNGSLLQGPPISSLGWNIHRMAVAVSNANYFDIPSMVNAALAKLATDIGGFNASSCPSIKKDFVAGFKIILPLYRTLADKCDALLYLLEPGKHIRVMLEDSQLRPLMEGEPRLMARLLEIEVHAKAWHYKLEELSDSSTNDDY